MWTNEKGKYLIGLWSVLEIAIRIVFKWVALKNNVKFLRHAYFAQSMMRTTRIFRVRAIENFPVALLLFSAFERPKK